MDTTDADALDRADMERHATGVFHFLCRMLGNEEDANDLAQETFVRVFRAEKAYRPEQRFSTWFFTIAANLARNQLRWRARHPNVSIETDADWSQSLGNTLPASGPTPQRASPRR